MRSSPSSVRRPRPSVSVPVAAQSGARIAPMPKAGSRRPSLSTSIVAHCLASSSGSRSPTEATFMPNLMRWVRPASAAITLITSRNGSSETRRSVCQRESTPPSSQRSTQRQKASAPENGNALSPSPKAIDSVASLDRCPRAPTGKAEPSHFYAHAWAASRQARAATRARPGCSGGDGGEKNWDSPG